MNYTLLLSDTYNKDDVVRLNLNLSKNGVDYSIPSINGFSVMCDHLYKISVVENESGVVISPLSIYLNDEEVNLDPYKGNYLFHDLYGVCRIEIKIGENFWISDCIRVMVKNDLLSNQVKNMVEYIYDNCEQFIYEDHSFSKLRSGFTESEIVTIDSKLALLEEIKKYYIDSYQLLKNSHTNDLVLTERVDPIEKVQYLNSKSLRYIATHPDLLEPTTLNTGITINKQKHMPTHTLCSCFVPTRNTYENQIVVGFISEIISDLKRMFVQVDNKKRKLTKPCIVSGYIDSCYAIMLPGVRSLEKYQEQILRLRETFMVLMSKYRNTFQVDFCPVKHIPKSTNVFRSVPIYHRIYLLISKWFKCGSYDMKKTDFMLSFLSASKIYEYYVLIKLKKSIEDLGYKYSDIPNKVFKYPDSDLKYYKNTKFQNTFKFVLDKEEVKLYFQPIIFANVPKPMGFNDRPNNINLYRTTTKKVNKNFKKFAYYTPDFIIVHNTGDHVSYHILDAKFSTFETIEKMSITDLVFKYIFSISTINENDTINSLCLIFGKEQNKSFENIHDIAEQFNKKLSHNTYFVSCNGQSVEDNQSLNNMLKKILAQ